MNAHHSIGTGFLILFIALPSHGRVEFNAISYSRHQFHRRRVLRQQKAWDFTGMRNSPKIPKTPFFRLTPTDAIFFFEKDKIIAPLPQKPNTLPLHSSTLYHSDEDCNRHVTNLSLSSPSHDDVWDLPFLVCEKDLRHVDATHKTNWESSRKWLISRTKECCKAFRQHATRRKPTKRWPLN